MAVDQGLYRRVKMYTAVQQATFVQQNGIHGFVPQDSGIQKAVYIMEGRDDAAEVDGLGQC